MSVGALPTNGSKARKGTAEFFDIAGTTADTTDDMVRPDKGESASQAMSEHGSSSKPRHAPRRDDRGTES